MPALSLLGLTVVAQLAPPVLSHALARRWGREHLWLHYATAYNWCYWAHPGHLGRTVLTTVLGAGLREGLLPARWPATACGCTGSSPAMAWRYLVAGGAAGGHRQAADAGRWRSVRGCWREGILARSGRRSRSARRAARSARRRARSRAAQRRRRPAPASTRPSPTSFSVPTMLRTWWCRKLRASARIRHRRPPARRRAGPACAAATSPGRRRRGRR